MRDKLIHNYFGVDIEAVWDAVKKDIPILKSRLKNTQWPDEIVNSGWDHGDPSLLLQ